jgi:hypothetical protein
MKELDFPTVIQGPRILMRKLAQRERSEGNPEIGPLLDRNPDISDLFYSLLDRPISDDAMYGIYIEKLCGILYAFYDFGNRITIEFGVDRLCRGAGIAGEARRVLEDRLFADTAATLTKTLVSKENPASIRANEKGGYRVSDGGWCKQFSLSREDWLGRAGGSSSIRPMPGREGFIPGRERLASEERQIGS